MAWVDYVFIGIVLISVLIGLLRGFIREALSLATWIFAFVVTLRYGSECAEAFRSSITSEPLRLIAGYAVPFFLVLLVGGLATWLIARAVRGAGLAPVDRMLGCGFGLLRGSFIVLALVVLAGITSLGRETWWRQSTLVPQIQPFAKVMQSLIPAAWLAYMQSQQATPPPLAVHQREK